MAIRVGRPQVRTDLPSHVPGVPTGNGRGNLEREPGIVVRGRMAVGTARRSTGICPRSRNPIDARMPNLSPP